MSKKEVQGLLISAGLSGRMREFKPLMTIKGEPYVVSITRKLLKVCGRVVVVTGHKSDMVESVLRSTFPKGIEIIFNPGYEKGMFTSLQMGAGLLKDSNWVIYHFVDQPFHKEEFYADLVSNLDPEFNWIQPVYGNQEGHPIVLGREIVNSILQSPPGSSLRDLKKQDNVKIKYWNCPYPDVLTDYDTKEDIARHQKQS